MVFPLPPAAQNASRVALKDLNIGWPPLFLTEDESKYVATYATKFPDGTRKPGVLRRSYAGKLVVPTNLPNERQQLSYQFRASGRYTRLFAVTFSGNVDFWRIKLTTTPGEVLVDEAPVNALLNVPSYAGRSANLAMNGGNPATVLLQGSGLLYFEPNVVLEGTSAIDFEGFLDSSWISSLVQPTDQARAVLNIGVHVWEFPDVPRSRGIGGTGQRPARPNAAKQLADDANDEGDDDA